ncbi:hypothetical protein OEA41_002122 [Lepraria neglecta]|uniref:TauD/TfdA-like domain-containing protein n=1 Tax=Lepraria neglecta TaxID=209136 RepID=A0AAD9ZAZ2_9LECA|nr:hypothetical protein OEA41_002122 [Lepraria neglecta]
MAEKLRLDALKLNPPAIGPDRVYADIEYKIDENKYDARSQARIRAGGLETSLPIGWPNALDKRLVWTGADLEDEGQYVLSLGDAEKAELVAALRHFKRSEPAPPTVSRENFPLENLGNRLDKASDDIYEGKGFVIVRGLDPDSLSTEDFTIMYLGISRYIAEKRGQARLARFNAKPDWPFDTIGRDPAYYRRCTFTRESDPERVAPLVARAPTIPSHERIPGLSEAQAEALDAFHFIAEKHEISPMMEKGDMRFFNNIGTLHRREAFENDEACERHLIRIWLNNEAKSWKLPTPLKLAWARVFEDDERATF